MFFNNYGDYFPEDYNYRVEPGLSHVRIFHASPDTPAVDVYANGKIIARRLTYQGFTEYMHMPAGDYQVSIFLTGKKIAPIVNTRLTVPASKILTIAAINQFPNIELFPVDDSLCAPDKSKTYFRFAHLAPTAPSVDVTTQSGDKLFSNVSYKMVTNYVMGAPGTYTLELKPAGTNTSVLHVPNIQLKGGKAYTVYAVGLVGKTPPLQVLIPLDGCSYIKV